MSASQVMEGVLGGSLKQELPEPADGAGPPPAAEGKAWAAESHVL